jgi:hypothetical protein
MLKSQKEDLFFLLYRRGCNICFTISIVSSFVLFSGQLWCQNLFTWLVMNFKCAEKCMLFLLYICICGWQSSYLKSFGLSSYVLQQIKQAAWLFRLRNKKSHVLLMKRAAPCLQTAMGKRGATTRRVGGFQSPKKSPAELLSRG